MADLKDAIEGIKKTIEDAVASGDLIPRADAQAAVALMVAQAATQADPWDGPVTKNKIVDAQAIAAQQIKARIRALAPADGLAAVDALRAEARENAMQALASMGQAQEAYEAQLEAEAELARVRARGERLVEALAVWHDGSRPIPFDRDTVGRMVREAWVRWAKTQPSPKPSWLVPYEELSEPDKEADRQIGEAVARWTLAFDAARAALTEGAAP